MSKAKNIAQAVRGSLGQQLLSGYMQIVRGMPKTYHQSSEGEQKMLIARAAQIVEESTTGAVGRILRGDHKSVPVKIESISLKAATKVTVAIESDEQLHALIDYRGRRAVLVFLDPEQYLEGMDQIQADADQPELPLDTPLFDTPPPAEEPAGEGGTTSESDEDEQGEPPPENPTTLGEAEPDEDDEDELDDALDDVDEEGHAGVDNEDEGGEPAEGDNPDARTEEGTADPPPDTAGMTNEKALAIVSTCEDPNDPEFKRAMAFFEQEKQKAAAKATKAAKK